MSIRRRKAARRCRDDERRNIGRLSYSGRTSGSIARQGCRRGLLGLRSSRADGVAGADQPRLNPAVSPQRPVYQHAAGHKRGEVGQDVDHGVTACLIALTCARQSDPYWVSRSMASMTARSSEPVRGRSAVLLVSGTPESGLLRSRSTTRADRHSRPVASSIADRIFRAVAAFVFLAWSSATCAASARSCA